MSPTIAVRLSNSLPLPNIMNHHRVISAEIFKWTGKSGSTFITDIPALNFNPFNGSTIEVTSSRTGVTKIFDIDTTVAGWEDGWDGEACYYASCDGFKIAFFND